MKNNTKKIPTKETRRTQELLRLFFISSFLAVCSHTVLNDKEEISATKEKIKHFFLPQSFQSLFTIHS